MRRLLLALLFVVPAGSATAGSTYSAGGLGEPSLEEPARLRALGGAGAAEHGPRNFSLVNPASVAEVDRLILEGTVLPGMRHVESLSGETEDAHDTVIPSLRALVRLPMRIVLGAAYIAGTNGRFGIDRPESSGTPSTLRIDGTGGIDLIRATIGRQVNRHFNVGVDYEVIVGSYQEQWSRDFADTALATTRDTLETTWEKHGRWRLGAQLHSSRFGIGAAYEFERRLPLETTQTTSGSSTHTEHLNLVIPSGFAVGASAQLTNRMRLAGQYRRANWSRESLQSDLVAFRPLERYGAGVEWLPPAINVNAPFYRRLPLRLGASLLRWPDLLPVAGAVDISGGTAGIEEKTVYFGTGIRSVDKGGSIDMTLEAGTRGDKSELGISEKFLRFAITLQVSDDTWR
ncbi:MAG TPA: hypothetical protein VGQ14_05680 [Candidatus Eisenbacteria bacterium]|nr:hypothetical protein [Candidatus Eisenbacteria bacterium]